MLDKGKERKEEDKDVEGIVRAEGSGEKGAKV